MFAKGRTSSIDPESSFLFFLLQLMREFEVLSATPASLMRSNWNVILPKLVEEFCSEDIIEKPETDDIGKERCKGV